MIGYEQKLSRLLQGLLYLLFAGYVLVALQFILFKTIPITDVFRSRPVSLRSVNLIPFSTISALFTDDTVGIIRLLQNIAGNIVLFIPLGIFVSYAAAKRPFRFKISLLAGVTLSLELIQYVFALGSSDIDDMLLNLAGGLLGMSIYQGFGRVARSREQLLLFMVSFLIVSGISGLTVIGLTNQDLLPFGKKPIQYIDVNKEIMSGLEEGTADLMGDLIEVGTNSIMIFRNPKYSALVQSQETSEPVSKPYLSIACDPSTKIFVRHLSSVKNQVITTYETGTADQLAALLSKGNRAPIIKVWLSDADTSMARALLISLMD